MRNLLLVFALILSQQSETPVAPSTNKPTGEGVVSGRITSTNGQPLVGMEVLALRKTFDEYGWPVLTAEGQRGETNDRGEYRIADLPSGKYYVRAASPFAGIAELGRIQAQMGGRVAPVAPSPGEYAPVFYPGVAESAKASVIQTNLSEEIRNINIILPRQALYHIRGRVIDPSISDPPLRVMLGTIPARAEFVSGVSASVRPYKPDGTFELEGITPGIYWVRAQLPGSAQAVSEVQLRVTPNLNPAGLSLVNVIDSDVNNVEVSIMRDLHVNGSVTIEGRAATSTDRSSLKVQLRPLLAGRLNPPLFDITEISPDGTFTCKYLPAGELKFTMSPVPSDLYLKEARLGNVDALTELLLLTAQPTASLQIVLAKGIEVNGVVNDGSSRPAANQQVVLIPDRPPNRPDLYKTATTDANGRFRIQGVAPGDYKAYAWQSIEPFQYFDSTFVSQFEERGSAVRVQQGGSVAIELRLLDR